MDSLILRCCYIRHPRVLNPISTAGLPNTLTTDIGELPKELMQKLTRIRLLEVLDCRTLTPALLIWIATAQVQINTLELNNGFVPLEHNRLGLLVENICVVVDSGEFPSIFLSSFIFLNQVFSRL